MSSPNCNTVAVFSEEEALWINGHYHQVYQLLNGSVYHSSATMTSQSSVCSWNISPQIEPIASPPLSQLNLFTNQNNGETAEVANQWAEIEKEGPAQPIFASLPRTPQRRVEKLESDDERKCAHCNTSATPMFRRGPNQCLLCNRCGLRWRRQMESSKREKKSKNRFNPML